MGASVLESRVTMNVSRSDEIALLGMAENMFGIAAKNYQQLVVTLHEISEQTLDPEDSNWEAQRDYQLRVITFIQVHKIK
ncbi:hypothetical protein D3C87_1974330 [compost metagenome]